MVATAALARPTTRRGLYVGLATVTIAIAAVGFWPTYFGPLAAGTVDKLVVEGPLLRIAVRGSEEWLSIGSWLATWVA